MIKKTKFIEGICELRWNLGILYGQYFLVHIKRQSAFTMQVTFEVNYFYIKFVLKECS